MTCIYAVFCCGHHEQLLIHLTVNASLHAETIEDFSLLTEQRLNIHVPATTFPAVIKIKLERCLEVAKRYVEKLEKQQSSSV